MGLGAVGVHLATLGSDLDAQGMHMGVMGTLGNGWHALGVHPGALGVHSYALGSGLYALGVHLCALGMHLYALGMHLPHEALKNLKIAGVPGGEGYCALSSFFVCGV